MTAPKKPIRIIPILGDQLSMKLSSLAGADKARDIILMCEVQAEARSVNHHKKKLVFIFSAMRHHADALRQAGWTVEYIAYDEKGNTGSFADEVKRAVDRHNALEVLVTRASEYRVFQDQQTWEKTVGVRVTIYEDYRFICDQQTFQAWAKDRKTLRMEYFYRQMRRETGLLMAGDKPEGGAWNYDKDNRKAASADLFLPKPYKVPPDTITKAVIKLISTEFNDHFGTVEPFWYGVTQQHAQEALDHFIREALPLFGDYQDAMVTGEPFLYHSLLSFYMNAGLLDPLSVCQQVEAAYYNGHAPLNAVEGYIRQIIGWREYMNGIYWLHAATTPQNAYTDLNYFDAKQPVPDFYWTGDTDMACLRAAIEQTQDHAYAHHIQRLMVTGLFAMLIGANPEEVHEWYLAVYIDAFEWVEAPNVIGMSQYADGGQLGSKPYAASGAYINRMSNYCGSCPYNVTKKTESTACPFNALYWDFLVRHSEKLATNPRMAQMYRTWNRMSSATQQAYRKRAASILSALEKGKAHKL